MRLSPLPFPRALLTLAATHVAERTPDTRRPLVDFRHRDSAAGLRAAV